jgi:hypothetical protein
MSFFSRSLKESLSKRLSSYNPPTQSIIPPTYLEASKITLLNDDDDDNNKNFSNRPKWIDKNLWELK